MAVFESTWDAARGLLIARLSGAATVADVRGWRASLERALARIEPGGSFGLISDLSGYALAEIGAHKHMREVIPRALAAHGLRTALLDLFEGAELPLQTSRGVRCVAAAHVHHDVSKMQGYERLLGRAGERFFTARAEAEAWVLARLACV